VRRPEHLNVPDFATLPPPGGVIHARPPRFCRLPFLPLYAQLSRKMPGIDLLYCRLMRWRYLILMLPPRAYADANPRLSRDSSAMPAHARVRRA